MGKLRTVYLALLNKKEKIVKSAEIIEVIKDYDMKLNKISIKNALWYLSRYNYIKRIFLDYYYINSIEEREREYCNYEDKELLFMILNKSKIRWYLGLSSALYTLGRTWQTPNKLNIINNKISGNKKILNMNVHFIKIKDSLIFGLKKGKTKNGIVFHYSNIAKTDLDMVYFRITEKISKDGETKKYLKKYPTWLQKLI